MASTGQNYQGFNVINPPQATQQQDQYYYDPQNPPQEQDQTIGSQQPGMQMPAGKNTRPFVDPEAHGEVDPTSYPTPKEATHKIRGKSDILELLCNNVSQELLMAKTFYFFFFSAFGSLFPLMAVYFKQMGMNPCQTGFLIGCRPFVEFIATPFWGSIADRFQKGKLMLLCSVGAWIIFTLSVGFVQPPATSCVVFNGTHHILRDPLASSLRKRSVSQDDFFDELSSPSDFPLVQEPPVLPHLFHKRSLLEPPMSDDIVNSHEEEENPVVMAMKSDQSVRRKREMPVPQHVILRKRNVKKADFPDGSPTPSNFPIVHDSPILPHLFHKRSLLEPPLSDDVIDPLDEKEDPVVMAMKSGQRVRRKRDTPLPPNHVVGKSPNVVHYTINYSEYNEAESWLSPPFSSIVYREADVQKVFFLLTLLVILGEFFSCPAITLADTAVLNYLGDEADQYGSQRMFGSLGWGLAMFFVGIALDHSTAFPGHPCGPHEKERNYTICFAVFSVLMGCAFITATQFKFDHSEPVSNTIPLEEIKEPVDNGPRPWNEPKIPMQQTKTGRQQFEEAIGNIKTRIFANTMKEMPEWMVVLREFKTLRCSAFLFVAWWMGFGIGLIFAFLFWHLQDYGGTPTVFGIASIINHISEIFAYFFSFRLIAQIGHVKVLCLGLSGNVIRFLYISWIKNPWWVLPFEFIQGITHAAVWAACCSYIAHNTKTELRASAQGVLQGLHHGFGRGAGAIIGGIFVNYFGTPAVFRGYGVVSLIILGAFIFINFYRKDVGFQHELPPEEDPRQMAEEGTALAPHGVPANPMPRAHSSQKLNDMNDQSSGYGTYSNNGMLDIPGGGGGSTNPFVQGDVGGGGGGGGGAYQYSLNPPTEGEAESKPKICLNPEYRENSQYMTNPFLEDSVIESVMNYKGSPVTSPVFNPDYDEIKNKFQAYTTLLRDLTEGKYKDYAEEGAEGTIAPSSSSNQTEVY